MRYHPILISQRTEALKKLYTTLSVPREKDPYHSPKYRCQNTGDRFVTLGYLRGFEKYKTAPTTLLRMSYAEAEELRQSAVQILDHELLLGHLYLPEYSEEEQAEYDRLADAFDAMSPRSTYQRGPRKDHIALDLEKLLRVGINGLRREIQQKLDTLDTAPENLYPDLEPIKKQEFYECCLIELNAVSELAARYSEEALRLAKTKEEPRRSELIHLGNMLKRVPNEPATTFWEALQSIQFFLSTLFGLYPLGRPDRYLWHYYRQDIANGTLTVALAQELIDNFCLCVSDRVFSRAACGFIVGGRELNGNTVENDLTYMFITALDHLKLPDPNGALAVTPDTSEELLSYCAEILSHGTSHPAFYNDTLIVDSLVKHYHIPLADAVNYIHTTCAENTVIGKSKGHTTSPILDMPRMLAEAARRADHTSFDDLFRAFTVEVKRNIEEQSGRYALSILEGARVGNDAMRVCTLVDDCLARGKSIYEGGEHYTFIQPILIGFATVVDSLLALSHLVYKEKRLTLAEFNDILDKNFEGHEYLRQYIIHKLPHYGNDNEEADAMAARTAAAMLTVFDTGNICMRQHMMPGTFSYITHAGRGKKMGATFDGRLAGYSYSDGCGAVQGRDTNGPTAMILSLTSFEQGRLLGGMVVNVKFGRDGLNGAKKERFLSLLKAFLARGGMELQVNTVDRQTLLDAREHPEQHGDLLVRIGGYSDYFVRLNPTLQQEIIDRTEY